MTSTESAAAADQLLTPEAVRRHCGDVFEAGLEGRLQHFKIDKGRLPAAADVVCQTIGQAYPTLDIPPHARWRHFMIDGRDRWAAIARCLADDRLERARIECELAITSVLLDAGAGARWRYRDTASGRTLARSEGLAIASLDLFVGGAFSNQPGQPLRADADALSTFTAASLEQAFQVGADNPLDGVEGRAALMQRLGRVVAGTPQVFGIDQPRLGHIADHFEALATGQQLAARDVLITLLNVFGDIWPGRIALGGRSLGDTWRHGAASGQGLVPFHKLSQWLTYSLLEPLGRLGLIVTDCNALTGLAEYRNGGLFIDSGVLQLRDPAAALRAQEPGSELVVEWRALTVSLLDEIAPMVRTRLGPGAQAMPLASILEGGTWAAGRHLASRMRAGGGPPITIVSDGSVF